MRRRNERENTMKTGRNLQEVLVELNRQNQAKQDFISPAQGMRLREEDVYKRQRWEMRILISKCGIYTSQGKRVLLATRAVVNGRKAVAYVKNGQLQGYEYLDDFNEQCYSGPYMTFEDKKEQLRM